MTKEGLSQGSTKSPRGRARKPEGYAVGITVSLPQALASTLDAYARERGKGKSAVVAEAIRELLAREKR